MGKVVVGMTVSLDGFVNDRHGSVDRLYPDLGAPRKTEALRDVIASTGAAVMGRRAYANLSFTFVSDGIRSAIQKAKDAAGARNVSVIGGASTVQQCLKAGLAQRSIRATIRRVSASIAA